jgi:hypothetical protein
VAGTPAAPVVSSISPGGGAVGASVPVTLTGSNLGTDVVITTPPSITVSNVSVVSATQVTATFAVSSTAVSGSSANVTVTTSGGTSSPVVFQIQ